MDETIKNTTEEIENNVEIEENVSQKTDDELRAAIETQMTKLRRQNILIGAQTACSVILEKIITATSKPGKMSINDYKRVIKDIENFCRVGISRKINADGEAEPINNNNTKLMEETDESNTNESN